MNRHVNAIAGRLSLRAPQRQSLEILDRVTEIVPPKKGADIAAALATIQSEFPTVTDFEREFPSLCFALATGVGKTRLMGAFISYLHLAHGIENFFVLAPNLTIYNKLIADFTPNTPKYVFKGISEFATNPPAIITGDTYESMAGDLFDPLLRCRVNIFNISKINSEVRGGKAPRIKRLSEYIGQSYFEFLAGLPDLVLLMDESHRYRASAGVRAINELNPVLGLELTATPFVETPKGPVPFKNVILDYPLGRAMSDGFVKEPAVVTRKNFNPSGMSPEELERLKLEDGIRLHEITKVELETYARETENAIIKPFLLVIARDTTHAAALLHLIESDDFFNGAYKGRAIQVDSSKTGAEEEEMIQRLLKVERTDEPTEIVIHVNMLKEGWDVTNLYTIVPLRAANARILIEQSIGRGLRLPYGKRTGVASVDTLSIVAHDKFQEIIDEANKPGSMIHLKSLIMPDDTLKQRTVTMIAQSTLATQLGFTPAQVTPSTVVAGTEQKPLFSTPPQQQVAQLTFDATRRLQRDPKMAPSVEYILHDDVQAWIVAEVTSRYKGPEQLEIEGVTEQLDVAAVVATTSSLVVQQTMDIPRVMVTPKGDVRSGFNPFKVDCTNIRYQPPAEEMWLQYLRTRESEVISLGPAVKSEKRLEDHIVFGLIDFDDISYDDHAELLYDLAGQVVTHLKTYLEEEEVERVLRFSRRDLARAIHAQMQQHYWEKVEGYETTVSRGWTDLKPSAYTAPEGQPSLDFRNSPQDKTNWGRYIFGGFQRCLYPVLKFDSETERALAVLLDRSTIRWFKPALGQFQIHYRLGVDVKEYQPDFAAETEAAYLLIETKAKNAMSDPDVLAKRDAAVEWCRHASAHTATCGGKPWQYVLVPHDAVMGNVTLEFLAKQFEVR